MHFTNQTNNITKKLTQLKSYIIFKQSAKQREADRYSTLDPHGWWGIKNKARMEKLSQVVAPLLQNFEISFMSILFCYFSTVCNGASTKNLSCLADFGTVVKKRGVWVNPLKGKFVTKFFFFSDNVEWRSTNLCKMMSADVGKG